MNELTREELLWELAAGDGSSFEAAGGSLAELSDPELSNYRGGSLTDSDAVRIEQALSASTRERRRLERMAGIRMLAPLSVRRRLFLHAGDPGTRPRPWPFSSLREKPWLGLAAASIGVLVILGAWRFAQHGILPGDHPGLKALSIPEYRIQIEAGATVRSVPGESTAQPDTVVEISLLPETAPPAAVFFGLYRRADEGVERVPDREILSSTVNRGAASIRIAAKSLAGSLPGTYPFYIVVGPTGNLTESVPLDGVANRTAAIEAATGGRAYERTITILEPAPEAP